MQSTELRYTTTGCGGSSGIREACRNLNGGLGPNMYERGEGLHLATLRGHCALCAVRPPLIGGWWILAFLFLFLLFIYY